MMENLEFESRIRNGFFVGELRPPEQVQRVVSLVPSQTELLYDLGLREEVVGITLFCVHPNEWFKSKTRIGGTKKLQNERILELKPDLILANQEENTREDIEVLAKRFPVYVSQVSTINDAYGMISDIGMLVNKTTEANKVITKTQETFSQLKSIEQPKTVCYLIWKNPYMTVGGDTFISSMLKEAGFNNLFNESTRYPKISLDQMKPAELIFLSSEPYPFKEKDILEIQENCKNSIIRLVDGELFSWYGSRMLYSAEYFVKLRESLNS